MKREIKFRGRNIINGKWVYGCLVNCFWTYSEHHSMHGKSVCDIMVSGELNDWGEIEDNPDLCVTVDPETVGQLTGLKGKNGTDIYEGDIIPMKISGRYGQVTFNDEILAGTVEYDATQARFIIVFPQPQKSGIVSTEFGWGDKDIEVAGNVFEHPHLLNKQ